MEKNNYREQLGILNEMYPGKVALSVGEVAILLGVDRRTVTSMIVKKRLPATNVSLGKKNKVYIIPISAVARFSAG